jgi:hypothetical protein
MDETTDPMQRVFEALTASVIDARSFEPDGEPLIPASALLDLLPLLRASGL